jgi:hypothetical protein
MTTRGRKTFKRDIQAVFIIAVLLAGFSTIQLQSADASGILFFPKSPSDTLLDQWSKWGKRPIKPPVVRKEEKKDLPFVRPIQLNAWVNPVLTSA